jgi:hypothetical protein
MNGLTIRGHITRLVFGLAFVLSVALGTVLIHQPQEAAAVYDRAVACAEMEGSYQEMFDQAEAAFNRGDITWWNVYYHMAQGIARSMDSMGC